MASFKMRCAAAVLAAKTKPWVLRSSRLAVAIENERSLLGIILLAGNQIIFDTRYQTILISFLIRLAKQACRLVDDENLLIFIDDINRPVVHNMLFLRGLKRIFGQKQKDDISCLQAVILHGPFAVDFDFFIADGFSHHGHWQFWKAFLQKFIQTLSCIIFVDKNFFQINASFLREFWGYFR